MRVHQRLAQMAADEDSDSDENRRADEYTGEGVELEVVGDGATPNSADPPSAPA